MAKEKNIKITLDKVEELYPNHKVLSVSEYWVEEKGWFQMGSKLDPIEQIQECIQKGATILALGLESPSGKIIYPDYSADELIKKPLLKRVLNLDE